MICFTATLTGFLKKICKRHGAVFPRRENSRRRRRKARKACCPDRGKTFRKESFKVFCPTFCTLQKAGKSGEAAKGFNFVCTKPPLRRADLRFAKPQYSLQWERVVTFCVVQKVTKKHTGRSPATHDSKLCRKRFCKAFRRYVPKPVLPAKRRRKGFESVRKGGCTADARLIFFENGLLYCKLTVGYRG